MVDSQHHPLLRDLRHRSRRDVWLYQASDASTCPLDQAASQTPRMAEPSVRGLGGAGAAAQEMHAAGLQWVVLGAAAVLLVAILWYFEKH